MKVIAIDLFFTPVRSNLLNLILYTENVSLTLEKKNSRIS